MTRKRLLYLFTLVFGLLALTLLSSDRQSQAAASSNNSCTPAPSGLTAWYRAENNSYDSKETNHGTIQPSTKGAPFVDGKVGQAFSFDGIDDQISITGSSALNVGASNGLTVQMWIKPNTLNNEKALAEWYNGSLGTHLWINTNGYEVKPGYIFANLVDTNGNYHFISTDSAVVTANNFQHVALTYDKTTGEARLFYNGVVVKQLNLGIFTPQTSSAYNLYLGSRPGRSDSQFQGLMDEVQIFNRSLAQAEIQPVYNAGSAGLCTTTSTAGLQYYPLAYPIRLLDTRYTRFGGAACYTPGQKLGSQSVTSYPAQMTCQGLTIPSNASAIVGTATALNTPQGGNLRLYPAGEPLAEVSNVNFVPGRTVSNSFTVKLGTAGAFNIYSYSPSDVIIDVTGYYAAPGTGGLYYHQLPNPIRILETRPGESGYQTPGAPLSANSVRLQQAGNISYLGVTIPASARAVTGNATVVNNGFNSVGSVKLYPGDISQVVVTENINYVVNQTIPNAFTARLDSSGRFNIYTSATTHVLIDITGYYSTEPAVDQNGREGLLFNILPRPFRLLDTRALLDARAGETGCDLLRAKLSAQTVRVQAVRGRTCSNQTVPSTAKAIFGNATVVNNFSGAGVGNIRLYPGEQPLANASNLNYVQGDVMPNSFIVGLGTTNGAMNIWSYSSTDFIVDVSGYFSAS